MTKKTKLLFFGLNILVIAINAVVHGVDIGQLKLAAWIVQGLTHIATATKVFINSDYFEKLKEKMLGKKDGSESESE